MGGGHPMRTNMGQHNTKKQVRWGQKRNNPRDSFSSHLGSTLSRLWPGWSWGLLCCCHVFSFLPFIPSELVHWATKHLSRVLNSNNPNLIFSPWLSLVTPEPADQWDDCSGSLIKNTTNGSPELAGSPARPERGVEAAGRTDLAEVWSSPLLWLGRRS